MTGRIWWPRAVAPPGLLDTRLVRSTVHGAAPTIERTRQMSKKTKQVRKTVKAAKKAAKKAKKIDRQVDRSSVSPEPPFSS
jgi:hypothetical protein